MPRKKKSPNGEGGLVFNIALNPDIPEEAIALRVSRRKAKPHGERKRLIVAFLCAIEEYEATTGREFTVESLSALYMSGGGFQSSVTVIAPEPDMPMIVIGGQREVDPEAIGSAFMSSRESMFD